MTRTRVFLRWWLPWYAVGGALLVAVADLFVDVPLWSLPKRQLLPLAILLLAFGASALSAWFLWSRADRATYERVVLVTIALFGIAFIALLLVDVRPALAPALTIALLGMLLVPAFYSLVRWRVVAVLAMASLVAVCFATATVGQRRIAQRLAGPHTEHSYVASSLYMLKKTRHRGYFPPPGIRGGALALVGDRYVLATGDGLLYAFREEAHGLEVAELPYRIPLNGDEFAQAVGGEYAPPKSWEAARNSGAVQTYRFRVADILAQQDGSRLRLFATHHYWKGAHGCYVVRVSMIEGPVDAFLNGEQMGTWRTVFESTPCMSLRVEQEVPSNPFKGEEIGGRLAMLDSRTLLLALGAMGYDGIDFKLRVAQDPAYSYGKTLSIDLMTGEARIFTSGHRNPQGLYVDADGGIWSTDHGARGGDELNLLRVGRDYGWPTVTYGTAYGTMIWPPNPRQGEHDGFERPVFAWVPSVAVSPLAGIERPMFDNWHGDLIIGSLVGQSLYRVKVREGHPVLVEPISVGHRVRDLVEGHDGRLVLWTDDGSIVTIAPESAKDAPATFAALCAGCHTAIEGAPHGLGPNLWGIVGAKVAGQPTYDQYSSALHRFSGYWDEERLDEFLAHPQQAVPGTAMQFVGISDPEQRKQIVSYLKSLQTSN